MLLPGDIKHVNDINSDVDAQDWKEHKIIIFIFIFLRGNFWLHIHVVMPYFVFHSAV